MTKADSAHSIPAPVVALQAPQDDLRLARTLPAAQSTTRRGLFSGSAITVAALAAPGLAASADSSLAALWAAHAALQADLNADDGPGGLDNWTDEYRADDWQRLWAMERAVLEGAIHSHADAAAKLEAVNRAFEMGERGDESDALLQTIAWLRAR